MEKHNWLYAPPGIGKTTYQADATIIKERIWYDTDRVLEIMSPPGFSWARYHEQRDYAKLCRQALTFWLRSIINDIKKINIISNFKPESLLGDDARRFRMVAFLDKDRSSYNERISKREGYVPEWARSVPVAESNDLKCQVVVLKPAEYLLDKSKVITELLPL